MDRSIGGRNPGPPVGGPKGDDDRNQPLHITPRGRYKGYTVWAHKPEEVEGKLRANYDHIEVDSYQIEPCQLKTRKVTQEEIGQGSWFPFADRPYKDYLNKLDEYLQTCRNPDVSLNDKLHKIGSLKKDVIQLLDDLYEKQSQGTDTASDRARLEQLKDQMVRITDEQRALLGIEIRDVGEVYLTDEEMEAIEDFDRGQSATVSKILYADDFEGIFKASTRDQVVQSQAAQVHGVEGDAEKAALANRSVLFCELDSLLGVELTPDTFYAEHNFQRGSVQKFVKDSKKLREVEMVSVPGAEDFPGDQLQDILHGRMEQYQLRTLPGCQPIPQDATPEQLEQLLFEKQFEVVRPVTKEVLLVDLRHPAFQKAISDAYILDYLAGSVDRNQTNFLYTLQKTPQGETWMPHLIDNDLSFASKLDTHVHESLRDAHELQENAAVKVPRLFDARMAERIEQIDMIELAKLAETHHLHFQEAYALSERFEALKAEVAKARIEGRVVEEWNNETYKAAMADKNSYICRISQARLGAMVTMPPERLVDTLYELLPLSGPATIGKRMGQMPAEHVGELCRLYALRRPVQTFPDANMLVVLLKTALENNPNVQKQEIPFLVAELLPSLLGDPPTSERAAQLLYAAQQQELLSVQLAGNIMTKTLPAISADLNRKPLPPKYKQWEPRMGFGHAFNRHYNKKNLDPQKAFLGDCYRQLKKQPGSDDCVKCLQFWDDFNEEHLPKLRKGGFRIDNTEELKEALSNTNPRFLRRFKGVQARGFNALLEKELFKERKDRDKGNVTQVVQAMKTALQAK